MSGGPSPLQPVLAAQGEQLLAPADVVLVAQAGVSRLQLELGHVRRRHHRLGVDGRPVFDQRASVIHVRSPRSSGSWTCLSPLYLASIHGPMRRGRHAGLLVRGAPCRMYQRRRRIRSRAHTRRTSTMKAAYIETTGSPDVIRYGDLPTPTPKEGEVLVRVGAVAVNPIDLYIRAGIVRHAAAEAVHPRLRPGRHGRGGRPADRRASRPATASGAPTRGCSAGRARSPSTPPSARTGSTRRRPA